MSDQNQVKPEKSILDSNNVRLSAKNPAADDSLAYLRFTQRDGMPRFVVNTNNPNQKTQESGFGTFTAPFTPVDAFVIAQMIRQFALQKEPGYETMEVYGHPFTNGAPNKEITLTTEITIGRSSDGFVYLQPKCMNERRDTIKFPFGPSDPRYTAWRSKEGRTSPALISQIYALAWANLLEKLASQVMVKNYKHPEYKPRQGGNNRGGYGGGNRNNYSGGNRGNYNNQNGGGRASSQNYGGQGAGSSDTDEDIPF